MPAVCIQNGSNQEDPQSSTAPFLGQLLLERLDTCCICPGILYRGSRFSSTPLLLKKTAFARVDLVCRFCSRMPHKLPTGATRCQANLILARKKYDKAQKEVVNTKVTEVTFPVSTCDKFSSGSKTCRSGQ